MAAGERLQEADAPAEGALYILAGGKGGAFVYVLVQHTFVPQLYEASVFNLDEFKRTVMFKSCMIYGSDAFRMMDTLEHRSYYEQRWQCSSCHYAQ